MDLSSSECDVIYLYFMCCSVNGSVCLVCCVFDSVCELFGEKCAMGLGVVAIVLLNVMDVFSMGGGPLLDRPCMVFQILCVLFLRSQIVYVFCMSEVIFSFRSLRAGSQVFALPILFLCVILHTMWSDKSLQLLCILTFGMLCLSAISMMFVKIMLAVCMLVGMVV